MREGMVRVDILAAGFEKFGLKSFRFGAEAIYAKEKGRAKNQRRRRIQEKV